ncbi:class I adenylate-forming enzyme family protein [Streptomyces sp. NPDC091217]|uniref:class I adenylate-forming enzyme family protein n=1 Tax=Streptomyces sp. NPDC091217 TaxID=3365975 RepID=UPI00380054D6
MSFRNYVESLLDVLARDPAHEVLVDPDGRRTTAGELYDGILRTAGALSGHGVGRSSTVALLSGNRSEALVSRYAANLLGARVAFLHEVIHTRIAPAVVAHLVRSIDTGLLLIDPALPDLAAALLPLPDLPPALFLAPSPLGADLDPRDHHGPAPTNAARPEDDWCLRMTGGTTGIPKCVCMTHDRYLDVLAGRAALLHGTPCFLACASLAHSAGTTADAALLAGGRVVLHREFAAGEVLATIAREHVTDVWMPTTMLGQLLEHPAVGSTDTGSLRRLSYGGHLLSAARLRRAGEVFGPVVYGWYGQTEAGLITEVRPHEHTLLGRMGQVTAGRPVPGVEIAVRGETGGRLPAGQIGEIRVRSPQVMTGYWRQPGLNAEVLHDGWLRTGDAGYLDEEGYLYIAGRYKQMIKLAVGLQVFPAELEAFLLTHPAVAQCMVFGVRRPDDAEDIHAAVVPDPGHRPDPTAIQDFVTAHQGPLHTPSTVHVLTEMPLNPVGKPDRPRVLARLGLADENFATS